MAIKAGLVGVNPKGVDKNGMPIGSGGANVEAEIQQINLDIAQLQASKVGIGQLTANNKAFNFAYDSTTEKYGYKLDDTGDFHPFDGAAGTIGLNIPNPTMEGVVYDDTKIEYVSGGYQTVVTEAGIMLYADIIFKGLLSSYGNTPVTLPFYAPSIIGLQATGTKSEVEGWSATQYSVGNYSTSKRQIGTDIDVRIYSRLILICKVSLE